MQRRILAMVGLLGLCSAAAALEPPAPKLVVAVAVDQFSAGLFEQYRAHFRYGLKTLATRGAVFTNGYQSHAATETCPGHSTLLTGRHPAATGIVANYWLQDGRRVYCVEDAEVVVPGGRPGRSPRNLQVSTLGEWLRAADPQSRTVAVSGKDRAAITMAGHDPTAVFWWDDERGFNTYGRDETEARTRLATVAAFNARETVDAWAHSPPRWKLADRGCSALNHTGSYGGYTIQHAVPPPFKHNGDGPVRENAWFAEWFHATPLLDELTLKLAVELMEHFELGRRASTDLLAISLSATDYVGHKYGNQGPEMCDQLAHLDVMLKGLLEKLDARQVPYVLVLTADHGAIDAAENTVARGFPARRVELRYDREVNALLKANLGLTQDAFTAEESGLYLNASVPASLVPAVLQATVRLLRDPDPRLPWAGTVADAFTKYDVLSLAVPRDKAADELALRERYAESAHWQRSPDVFIVPQPYASVGVPSPPRWYIAGHGSPWNYDRRVPILFFRPGAPHVEVSLPVETVDIAPTLAALVRAKAPETDGRCLDLDPGTASSCAAP